MKLLRPLAWTLLALLALAAILLWTAPAEIAYRLFGARLAPLRLDGLSGTVWQGSAERSDALGHALGRVEWQVERGALLTRRLVAVIRLSGADVRGTAQLEAHDDVIEVHDLDGEFPAGLLGPALDIPALTLLGRVSFQFPQVRLRAGMPERVEGSAVWRDLAVAGAATAALPGLEVRFETAPDATVVGHVRDLGGPLALEGEVHLAGGRYRTETRLNLREPNPQLEEVLKFVGERTPEGGSILRVQGELKPLR
jgi:general secretion pathway protein N